MFAEERHREILKIIREERRMNFADLQDRIKVSPATLRRDLAELEAGGDLIRVHGGVLDPSYFRSEISFDERVLRQRSAKKQIATAAAALIPAGASVIVDSGSTCLEAGKALLGRKDIRILTNSVALLALALHGEAEVISVGGRLRKVSGALTGSAALGGLARLRADFALIGASGLDPAEGCSTTELSEAETKQAFLRRASQNVLLADFTKWKAPSTVHFATWADFHVWVSDTAPAPQEQEELLGRGVRIVTPSAAPSRRTNSP